MISTTDTLEPTHWGLTALERAARGRWFAVVAAVLCALAHVAAASPAGVLWPVVFFTAFVSLVALPVWMVGLVHALGARRLHPCADTRRAVAWWLFPGVALGATIGSIDAGLPVQASARLLESPLAALEEETRDGPANVLVLEDRLIGPFPCKDIRRYPNGIVRFEIRGAGLFEGTRGLVLVPEGEAMPYGLEITGDAVVGEWLPWLERDAR